MADNIIVKDGNGATVTMRTVEEGGVHSSAIAGYDPVSGSIDVRDNASGNLLLRILQMLMAPLGYDKSLQRQRVTALIESGTVTTVTTVTTVGTVTSLNNIDGYNARMQILDQNRTSWALNVRARIT